MGALNFLFCCSFLALEHPWFMLTFHPPHAWKCGWRQTTQLCWVVWLQLHDHKPQISSQHFLAAILRLPLSKTISTSSFVWKSPTAPNSHSQIKILLSKSPRKWKCSTEALHQIPQIPLVYQCCGSFLQHTNMLLFLSLGKIFKNCLDRFAPPIITPVFSILLRKE